MFKKIFYSILLCLTLASVCEAENSRKILKGHNLTFPSVINEDSPHFKEGKVLFKGQFVGYVNDPIPQNIRILANNLFTGANTNILVPVDRNGYFSQEITIPHSQYCFVKNLSTMMFMAVGDTIEIYYDNQAQKGHELTIKDNGISGEVNNHWEALKKQYYPNEYSSDQIINKGKIEVEKYCKEQISNVENALKDILSNKIILIDIHDKETQEILKYNLLSYGWGKTVEVIKDYSLNEYNYSLSIKTGEPIIEKNKDYEKIDDKFYIKFLKKHEDLLLNQPHTIFNPMSWILFNRAEFYIPFRDVTIHNDSVYIPLKVHAQEDLAKYKLSNSLFSQICICRYTSQRTKYDLSETWLNHSVSNGMTAIDNPLICHHFINNYQKLVLQKNAQQTPVYNEQERDTLLQHIINPYKGNLLYLDFWGMGCGPCLAGMLTQREIIKKYQDNTVKFLYICNEKDSPRKVAEEWMKQNNIKGEHIFLTHEEWNRISTTLNFSAIPFGLLIDKNGKIRKKGYINQLEEELNALLK